MATPSEKQESESETIAKLEERIKNLEQIQNQYEESWDELKTENERLERVVANLDEKYQDDPRLLN